jgi:cytochrome c oxidase assembly protein subunit 15
MRPGGGIAAGIGFAHRSTALVSPAAVIAASRSLSLQSAMIAPQRLACAHLRSATAAGARKKSSFTAPPAAGGAIPAQTEPAGEPVETEARANETARVEEVEQEERAGTRAMGWWLIGCSGMVAGMVVLGGVTRLTGSGLSMVKWRPTGIWPPATTELWEKEFEEFKQYPEWIMKRQYENFGLEDFKFIWYMEWSHRMAGRCVGIAFAVPLAYFAARGYVDGALGRRLGLLFCMGGSQGLVGWWMVKSGLQKDKINVEQAEAWQMNTQFASVSPYRLTTHLGSALAIYSLLLWTGLGLLDRRRLATTASSAARRVAWVQRLVMVSTGAAGLTAVSGGFVAGNKAGLAYNDWPFMGYPNLVRLKHCETVHKTPLRPPALNPKP